jgi:hypothetical protein
MTAATLKDAAASTPLPARAGPRPATTTTNPHTQLDQQPAQPLTSALVDAIRTLPGVVLGPSRRAPPRTIGFFLDAAHARGPAEAFMLGHEFAHVHPQPDSSLHLTLPEPLRSAAIAAGWAEPHPLAGYPTVSRDIVMVYAPRDAAELQTVIRLVAASWAYAAAS